MSLAAVVGAVVGAVLADIAVDAALPVIPAVAHIADISVAMLESLSSRSLIICEGSLIICEGRLICEEG